MLTFCRLRVAGGPLTTMLVRGTPVPTSWLNVTVPPAALTPSVFPPLTVPEKTALPPAPGFTCDRPVRVTFR